MARYIFSMQVKLLQTALAPWPRRSTRLLEINCGSGDFLPFFWHSGFEAEATEHDQDLRAAALASMKHKQEVIAAQDDYLPFEDDFYDWTILHLGRNAQKNPGASIREASRVARRGVLLTFWNRSSLPIICWRGLAKKAWPYPLFSWSKVWREMRKLRAGRLHGMTTLCAPVNCWRPQRSGVVWDRIFSFLSPGAWAVFRLDLSSGGLVTPLRLYLEKAMNTPEPALEYVNKNISSNQKRLDDEN